MRIALQNAFPNVQFSAEREFIQRCIAVLARLGHDAVEVATSDDILRFGPDMVLVTHELVAKTTHHFTAGLFFSPIYFSQHDPVRLQAIRSWDFVVPINADIRRFAGDVRFPAKRGNSISQLDFYPSSPTLDLRLPDHAALSLVYIGVRWDGDRHKQLLQALAERVDLHIYGPPAAWNDMGDVYRGPIPMDGVSVIETLNRHGAVLALHKDTHRDENTPSMRVFEGCAAGCLVLTERLPALTHLFGDSLSYIDTDKAPEALADEITGLLAAYRDDAARFSARAKGSYAAFRDNASLDVLLPPLLSEIEKYRASSVSASAADISSGQDVTVIIRCGARPLVMVQRAVASLAHQTHRRIGIVFARFGDIEGFEEWLPSLSAGSRFLFAKEIVCAGRGVRSSSMWAGLRSVDTDLFCMLDDDDEIFPTHLSDLTSILNDDPDIDIAYSGTIRHMEDDDRAIMQDRFEGDLGLKITERRSIEFFDDFDLDRLLKLDNFITSNGWLARRKVLTAEVLEDPELEVAEDFYFLLLLASRHSFRFSGSASALWNRHSGESENSMSLSPDIWNRNQERVIRRLSPVIFPGGYLGRDVLCRGRAQSRIGAANPAAKPPGLSYSINFATSLLPSFVLDARGLSVAEPWGRWSVGSELRLTFRQPLPKRFRLRILGHAFDSNVNQPIRVLIGPVMSSFAMRGAGMEIITLDLSNDGGSDSLIFRIPNPQSPAIWTQGKSVDRRQLGIGLMRLDIVETPATV